jgi:hypothetical protein
MSKRKKSVHIHCINNSFFKLFKSEVDESADVDPIDTEGCLYVSDTHRDMQEHMHRHTDTGIQSHTHMQFLWRILANTASLFSFQR